MAINIHGNSRQEDDALAGVARRNWSRQTKSVPDLVNRPYRQSRLPLAATRA
jgi:hypothetical protein